MFSLCTICGRCYTILHKSREYHRATCSNVCRNSMTNDMDGKRSWLSCLCNWQIIQHKKQPKLTIIHHLYGCVATYMLQSGTVPVHNFFVNSTLCTVCSADHSVTSTAICTNLQQQPMDEDELATHPTLQMAVASAPATAKSIQHAKAITISHAHLLVSKQGKDHASESLGQPTAAMMRLLKPCCTNLRQWRWMWGHGPEWR